MYTRISYFRDWIIANSNYRNNRIITSTNTELITISEKSNNKTNITSTSGPSSSTSTIFYASIIASVVLIIIIVILVAVLCLKCKHPR